MNKEFDINAIAAAYGGRLKNYKREFSALPAGVVTYCGDGVIRVSGLARTRSGELLLVENGVMAIALNLEEDSVGAIVLEDESKIAAGMMVKSAGTIVSVPVGEQMLGRVVNPLGEAIDGLGAIKSAEFRPIESPAPAITDRAKVDTPLQTGILAIDSMIPIGRGQRELIIGDRQTGKTAIAIDTIINQRGKNVVCVYVSIGQKASTIANVV
ncbi:MAG: F0F1 ATP synthase subunit alpha, partial [Firmicutes bacterium]|nr:F0F1 ATP synthase subunit alpha [Bacillota bacterium]